MRKFALTVALFAAALILVGVASAVHRAYPLFLMWVPLLAVPYVLTRPEAPPAEPPPAEGTQPERVLETDAGPSDEPDAPEHPDPATPEA
jgi:hypothetical protein